jgi:hypothetical protein
LREEHELRVLDSQPVPPHVALLPDRSIPTVLLLLPATGALTPAESSHRSDLASGRTWTACLAWPGYHLPRSYKGTAALSAPPRTAISRASSSLNTGATPPPRTPPPGRHRPGNPPPRTTTAQGM